MQKNTSLTSLKDILNENILPQEKNMDNLNIEYIFDFSYIPFEILNKQYVDLSFFAKTHCYGSPFLYNTELQTVKKMNESANRTLSKNEVISELKRTFHFADEQIRLMTDIQANNIELIIFFADTKSNTDLIINAMDACGWFYSNSGLIEDLYHPGFYWKALSFDPIYQEAVNDEIKQCSTLYHWAPYYKLFEIFKKGLEPKSENTRFSYPPKIHLMKGSIDMYNCYLLGEQLYKSNKNLLNDGKYALLNVDTTKIPYKIDFFYDPRYEHGYYTKQKICKEAISQKEMHLFKK